MGVSATTEGQTLQEGFFLTLPNLENTLRIQMAEILEDVAWECVARPHEVMTEAHCN